MSEHYRIENEDSVFEHHTSESDGRESYVFVGKLNGRTEEQFIYDYETADFDDERNHA